MGYLYDAVVKSMGGKYLETPLKEGQTLKGWSPNQYKRLIILHDGILVERYLGDKSGKITRLEPNQVYAELSSPKQYRNPLAALFDYKSFSCLEELIISRNLVTDNMLNAYLSKLTDTHRLRGIGFVEEGTSIELIQKQLETLNEVNAQRGFTLSEELGFSFKKLANYDTYWKRFLLRPQLYAFDSENGHLRRYFDAIKQSLEKQSRYTSLLSDAEERIAEDSKSFYFWELLISYLKSDRPKEEMGLGNTLKQIILANPNSYTEGLKEYYSKHEKNDMYVVYGTFGYFSNQGGGNRRLNQKGYLPSRESVGERAYKELGILFNKNHKNLQSLRITTNASEADILERALRFLLEGLGEMEALLDDIGDIDLDMTDEELALAREEEKEKTREEIKLSFLSYHDTRQLLFLLAGLFEHLPFTTKCYLKDVSDGISINRDALIHTNLHETSIELLEWLGCVGQGQGESETKTIQKQLSLIKERLLVFLDKVAHVTTTYLEGNIGKKWLTTDTIEGKMSYISDSFKSDVLYESRRKKNL